MQIFACIMIVWYLICPVRFTLLQHHYAHVSLTCERIKRGKWVSFLEHDKKILPDKNGPPTYLTILFVWFILILHLQKKTQIPSLYGTFDSHWYWFLLLFHRLAAGRLHYVSESVSLPVLRPNGAANVADRKRRQQAVVRGRAGKKDFWWYDTEKLCILV